MPKSSSLSQLKKTNASNPLRFSKDGRPEKSHSNDSLSTPRSKVEAGGLMIDGQSTNPRPRSASHGKLFVNPSLQNPSTTITTASNSSLIGSTRILKVSPESKRPNIFGLTGGAQRVLREELQQHLSDKKPKSTSKAVRVLASVPVPFSEPVIMQSSTSNTASLNGGALFGEKISSSLSVSEKPSKPSATTVVDATSNSDISISSSLPSSKATSPTHATTVKMEQQKKKRVSNAHSSLHQQCQVLNSNISSYTQSAPSTSSLLTSTTTNSIKSLPNANMMGSSSSLELVTIMSTSKSNDWSSRQKCFDSFKSYLMTSPISELQSKHRQIHDIFGQGLNDAHPKVVNMTMDAIVAYLNRPVYDHEVSAHSPQTLVSKWPYELLEFVFPRLMAVASTMSARSKGLSEVGTQIITLFKSRYDKSQICSAVSSAINNPEWAKNVKVKFGSVFVLSEFTAEAFQVYSTKSNGEYEGSLMSFISKYP